MQIGKSRILSSDDFTSRAAGHRALRKPLWVVRLTNANQQCDTNSCSSTAITAHTNLGTLHFDGRTPRATTNVWHFETQTFLALYGKWRLLYSTPVKRLCTQPTLLWTRTSASTSFLAETSQVCRHRHHKPASKGDRWRPTCCKNHGLLAESYSDYPVY